MAYATLADVRNFGITSEQADDAAVNAALEIATVLVNAKTGTTFDGEAVRTITRRDVRNGIVTLPTPYRDITTVAVNGVSIDSNGYQFDDDGVLLLYRQGRRDVDGFPTDALRGVRTPPGATVAVTATFGYASVPLLVSRACVMLAAQLATEKPTDDRQRGIKKLSVEGYSVEYDSGSIIKSTGNSIADQLLEVGGYCVAERVQVG